MSCEYCKNEINPYNSYYKVGFVIEDNSILIYKKLENDCSEILLERNIKYCPFCGDKLPKPPDIKLGERKDLWEKKEAEIAKPSIQDVWEKQIVCSHEFEFICEDRITLLDKYRCKKCGMIYTGRV